MRAAMAEAEVGDDVYGEDPTVNALEARVADAARARGRAVRAVRLAGQPARASGCSSRPGEELVCDSLAHIARAELGAAAVFSGITFRTWRADRGRLDVDAVARADRARRRPVPRLDRRDRGREHAQLRRRHGAAGRRRSPRCGRWPREHGLRLHLDGARLWNAHVATGTPLAELAAGFDTVSVCLSKGLGAPVGSVLVSTAERIAEARVWRKRYGGGMRQVGILAAAGRYALAHHLERLADDHARARRLAEALGADPAERRHQHRRARGRRRAGARAAQAAERGRAGLRARPAVPAAGHPPRRRRRRRRPGDRGAAPLVLVR